MTYLPTSPAPQTGSKASHDSQNPPALLKFMTTRWKPRRLAVTPVRHARAHAARRAALSNLFPGEALFIPTGHEKVRANDTYFRFRPGSDFYYLTGNTEPDAVLLLEPKGARGHRSVLFVEPNPGKSDQTFFTDRKKGELWVGPRLGVAESRRRFGVDEARPLSALKDALARHKSARLVRGLSPDLDTAVKAKDQDGALAAALSELRLLKDPAEVLELSAAIASTQRAFEDVIRGLKRFRSEREVEATFFYRARTEGNDVGYGTIAACGSHACTLHWTHNDGPVRRGELLLLDAGVEGRSLYTADITRTLPVSGRFSRAQRDIYELVWEAQAAAFTAVRPGNDFMEPNRRAMRVLAEGLYCLGILKVPPDEALDEQAMLYKRYTLHNVSHMLGLDVHDCAKARQESYKLGKLKPGMVLTVEPGLYFQVDDLTVPAKYRGIGVRIEDDVLVTAKGCRNLSARIPSKADDVERWMARVQRR
jgi:Xaa-Pro aminopeptidase